MGGAKSDVAMALLFIGNNDQTIKKKAKKNWSTALLSCSKADTA